MKELNLDLVIIGAGPAGMAAAVAAFDLGIVPTIIERDDDLGGILQQCIHPGFGLHVFDEELTGPEFGERYKQLVLERKIPVMLGTILTEINANKVITAYSPKEGLIKIRAKCVVLSMGARERTRGTIKIPGARPSGVYTAGLAQRWINMEGKMPGKDIVILGSGDIGLIMARRCTLEGAKVHRVVEILPYTSGLIRNKVQCLDDFNIPLLLSHTVTHIHENEGGRLKGVTIAEVDAKWVAVPGTEEFVPCDTLLLSVGLQPEVDFALASGIEISAGGGPTVDEQFNTTVPGIIACGNVCHIHDLVDNVVQEGVKAGVAAVSYLKKQSSDGSVIPVNPGNGILYVVPHRMHKNALQTEQPFQFRVRTPGEKVTIGIYSGDNLLKKTKMRHALPSEMITLKTPPIDPTLINKEIHIEIMSEESK